ncbi:MAG: hypothetical protein M3Z25_04475 [Actinomycetota bacterium]|nr:hypothetical protein [Actinomycetota bacterium]
MKNRRASSWPDTVALNTTAVVPDAGIGTPNTGYGSNMACFNPVVVKTAGCCTACR